MAPKRDRIDTSSERRPLTDSPFAALRGAVEAPAGAEAPPAPKASPGGRPYGVDKTRKGGYALRVERRAAGKTVTILEGVTGDAKTLLTRLKKHCGAGGALRDGAIELQGDHRAAVETFLKSGA